jgi:large subunit ribosomal protein L4
VAGAGKKLWKQKGTGRARVGSIRSPLWRHGGTTHGPQPHSYAYKLPRKMQLGALKSALSAKLRDGELRVVNEFALSEVKTKAASALLKGLGATGKTLIVDVKPDVNFALSVRNLVGVRVLPSNRITARDVVDTTTVIATRAALERLQEVLS